MKIGEIEIPIVSDIIPSKEAEATEIKSDIENVVVKHHSKVQTIVFIGFLNEEVHSENKTIEEQKIDIKKLRTNSVEENSINYKDLKGHLLVEEVDLNDNSDSKIVKEVEITTRYFPWPKYYSESDL